MASDMPQDAQTVPRFNLRNSLPIHTLYATHGELLSNLSAATGMSALLRPLEQLICLTLAPQGNPNPYIVLPPIPLGPERQISKWIHAMGSPPPRPRVALICLQDPEVVGEATIDAPWCQGW